MSAKHLLLLLLSLIEHPTPSYAGNNTGNSNNSIIGESLRSNSGIGISSSIHHLTRDHFGKILFTSLEDRETLQHVHSHHSSIHHHDEHDTNNLRRLSSDALAREEDAWQRMVRHGWNWSKRSLPNSHQDSSSTRSRKQSSKRNLRAEDHDSKRKNSHDTTTGGVGSDDDNSGSTPNSPFVVCSTSSNQSGHRRRRDIANQLGLPMDHTQPVYNTDEESCFIVTASAHDMESYHNSHLQSNTIVNVTSTSSSHEDDNMMHIGPLLDVLKLPKGTAHNIMSNDEWSPSDLTASHSTKLTTNEFSYDNVTEERDVDIRKWSRTIMVELLPGTTLDNGDGENSMEDVSARIIEFVKDMAQESPPDDSANVNNNSGSSSSSYLRSRTATAESPVLSTRQAFSVTATATVSNDSNLEKEHNEKKLFRHPHNIWSNALINGFEAPHGCQVMLDTLEVRTRETLQDTSASSNSSNTKTTTASSSLGFEVLLHPPSQFMKQAAVESSAWNQHCALCLLMGLAVHPSVQTVEVGHTVELASFDVASSDVVGNNHHPSHHAHHRKTLDLQDVQGRRIPKTSVPPSSSSEDIELEELGSNDSSFHLNLIDPNTIVPDDPALLSNGNSNDLRVVFTDSDNNDNTSSNNNSTKKKEGVTNPQWITQSGSLDSRPFFDAGLDGSGQVVAVADGGLDQDNCYFRDASTSEQIYGRTGWDFTQRKIVHYDDSFGDRIEKAQGHGTYVSSIIAGKKSRSGSVGVEEGPGHADGTAPGSSLAFFDMANGYDAIADPGVDRLLKSLYNPTTDSTDNNNNDQKKGARVINASWGRSYNGQYTSFCRLYDTALQSQYPDLLFVVSAGNTGRAGMSSIQDPADCKSPLAVGSTLSHGSDVRNGELGFEYLADYSSRGPTQDERMKPDIVAPGHFVLAARARPDVVGECDGSSDPTVKTNNPGGDGVRYTTGTSMAAPALAGAAAVLRQYFEEGYCSPPSDDDNKNGSSSTCCGSRGCGMAFNPSGSLMKAVLMNGAQPLGGGVQFVPSGDVLEDQPLEEYDSNQGMGRVNLLESVPLSGQNTMQMMNVNDKWIEDGDKDVYTVFIDTTDGCDRELSATLAWYDPPGAIGCTSCIVNDLDLSVKTAQGTMYPNGLTNVDTKNTVERVRTPTSKGEEVRIIVHARNLVDEGQRYSLAITGCFSGNAVQQQPTATTTATSAPPAATKPTSASRISSCPSNRQFQLTLNTANNGDQLTWNLIGSTVGNKGVNTIASGPPNSIDSYENNSRYVDSACLDPSKRYRFQLRNKTGGSITGRYKLSYGGQVVFNTQWSSSKLGRVSTFRFKTSEDGAYQQLGSNAFAAHMQSSEEAVLSGSEAADLGVLPSSYNDYNDGGDHALAPNQFTYSASTAAGEEEGLQQDGVYYNDKNNEEGGTSSVNWSMEYIASSSEDVEEVGEAKEAIIDPSTYEDHLEVEGDPFKHTPTSAVKYVERSDADVLSAEDAEDGTVEVGKDVMQHPESKDYGDTLDPEEIGDVFEHKPTSSAEYDREYLKEQEETSVARDINTGEPLYSAETLNTPLANENV